MKSINPYLSFPGNCEEAMNFYKSCLGGEIRGIMRWSQMPSQDALPPGMENRVMHSTLVSGGVTLMASDVAPNENPTAGSNITLNLVADTEQEQDEAFNKLSAGGKVTMPLQDTFWGARFGMLTDKYGVHWMFNYAKEQQ